MPWNMKDYPASMKNLDPLVRKKAIDIANALLNDGYTDDRAIPIATSQAEKWLENASEEEKKELTREIEKDIYDTWKKIRYSFDNNGK